MDKYSEHRIRGCCPVCGLEAHSRMITVAKDLQHYLRDDYGNYVRENLFRHLGEYLKDHIRKEHGKEMAYTYTTNEVWSSWTTSASTYTTAANDTTTTWYYWTTDAGTTNTGTATTVVWRDWTSGQYRYQEQVVGDHEVIRNRVYGDWQRPIETNEEKTARLAREREEREKLEREAAARREREKKVQDTARDLLRQLLTEEQNKQLDDKGYFELVLANGATYRISKGRSHNVKRISDCGRVIESLCFHPQEYLPDYDTMALQKLMLESDEQAARKSANITKH